jgi:predicted N-acetyltransferase YhbS
MNHTVDLFLNKATELEILNHLSACDDEFVKALRARADLKEYSRKIYSKAIRFEAWAGGTLVGLVAAYCNDQSKRMAYITSVSVLMKWQGKGIAMQLISRCIEHAKMYEKCGFVADDAIDSFITMNLFF